MKTTTTTNENAGMQGDKKISRQALWQRKKMEDGKCSSCGNKRLSKHSKRFCINCLKAVRVRDRERYAKKKGKIQIVKIS